MNVLRALLGLAFFCGLAWLLSSNRKRVDLRTVAGGLGMQVVLALLVLKTELGRTVLGNVSTFATKVLSFGEAGSSMVFGKLMTGFMVEPVTAEGAAPGELSFFTGFPFQHAEAAAAGTADIGIVSFAFKALPTILYFSAAMAILYHLGIMQRVIWLLAAFMTKLMRVSGAESLAMAANVFVGQTEAPLVVRPYVPKMTRSELMAMMTGGFATIAGSVLAVYIGILGTEFAGHLLAASFMSAPAAFVIAKIMVPETELSTTAGAVSMVRDEEDRAVNVLDAAAAGTSDGLKLYLNVLAMLIAFVSLVALIDAGLGLIDVQGAALSLSRIFGWLFSPVAWMMGVEWSDCQNFGTLLGTKVAVNEFIAFGAMADMQSSASLSPRSLEMAAYALCGFANFSSIGIQIGGITPLAPERRGEIASLAMRAMIGGAFASWMTATIAGAFL